MAKGTAEDPDEIAHVRKEPRPDFSKPLAKSKLPTALQETLDSEEKYWDAIYDGKASESTDSNLRYAAYASRLRTILVSAHRYVAYTSDIGESFRPVAHPNWVRAAYGVSWAYLAGDVSYEGYKAYLRNQRVLHPEAAANESSALHGVGQETSLGPGITGGTRGSTADTAALEPGRVVPIEDYRAVMAQRAIFQSIASMGLPAFTIHSIVRYSSVALKSSKNVRLRAYGPIGLGLATVPALPFLFDKPVEHAVEYIFHKGFELVGGPEAVHGRPVTGNKELRQQESREGAARDREL